MAVVSGGDPRREDAAWRRGVRAGTRSRRSSRSGVWVAVCARERAGTDSSRRSAAHADGDAAVSWRIRGTYFESCNCDAICPCRRIDGVPGGRSTHGVCLGRALVADRGGRGGRRRPLRACRSRWPCATATTSPARRGRGSCTSMRGRPTSSGPRSRQIFTGRLGGDASTHFPWAWKESKLRRRAAGRRSRSTTRAGASGCGSATT